MQKKEKKNREHNFGKQSSKSKHNEQMSQIKDSSDSQCEEEDKNIKENQKIQPSIEFGDSPIQLRCPFCLQNIRSEIILKPQFISILFAFSLFIIFPNMITILLTIIVLQITATRKHRCPLCQKQLGSDGKFLVFFKDQVYSFAFGTNGIIISKKIIASIGIAIFIFIIVSLRVKNAYADVQWTELTWQQFFRECPHQENSQKCMYQNQGLTVKNWHGFVMRVQDNRMSIKRHFEHAVSIFLKMNYQVSLNVNPQKPDLMLTITSFQANQWQQQLDNLSHGDEIVFNGTFTYLRNNRGIPVGKHLNLIDMNKTDNHDSTIHVYMTDDEDLWFFEKLSGQKLRKHKFDIDTQSKELQGEITNTYKQVQKQIKKIINQQKKQVKANPTKAQKEIIQENQQINKNQNSQPNI